MTALRWLFSLALLVTVVLWFDPGRVADQVLELNPGWMLTALLVTVIQTLLSAWRWRFTSARLGLILPWRQAVIDYYLACFANQTLPGGMLGDAWRAQRHAHQSGKRGAAWRAVILERASGQIMVVGLSLLSLSALFGLVDYESSQATLLLPGSAAPLVWSGLLLMVGSCLLVTLIRRRWPQHLSRFGDDLRCALLARDAWLPQLLSSLLIVASYTLVFALAARAIGVSLPWLLLMSAALPILLAMLIPLSIAGWGWREAMAGGLWLGLGLPPEQGVAVAIAYGVIVALGALPGLLVWLLRAPAAARPATPQERAARDAKSTSSTTSSPSG